MARKAVVLTSSLLLFIAALTGCSNAGEDSDAPGSATESPLSSESASAAACASESPGSEAQESCEAQGIPGVTEDADRCGTTTPSPIASGIIQGTFGTYCENAIASTYNTSLVPDGADTTITIDETDADTTLQMIVQGFTPNTEFTATLHQSLCGAEPSAAGPVYTHDQDSPQTLNLDFTTDNSGGSTATVTVGWLLPDDGIGRSLLLTTGTNSMSPGKENVDPAVACVSLER